MNALRSLACLTLLACPAAAQCLEPADDFELAGLDGDVLCLELLDLGDGPQLYAGGRFTGAAGGVPARGVARWNGTGWEALGLGVFPEVNAMAVFDDGAGPALYVGGNIEVAGSVATPGGLARWDGTTWSAVGTPPTASVGSLVVHDDGTGAALWVGSGPSGGGPRRVSRWDGTQWTTPAPDLSSWVSSMVSFDDGTGTALYASGPFETAGGVSTPGGIARWDGTSWSAVGGGVGYSATALVVFDDGGGPALFAGGGFETAGGQPARYVARWRNGTWSPLGEGASGLVRELAVVDDGSGPALFAVGQAGIERWNGTTWSTVDSEDFRAFDVAGLAVPGQEPQLIAGGHGLLEGSRAIVAREAAGWKPLQDAAGAGLSVVVPRATLLASSTFGGTRRLVAGAWFLDSANRLRLWDGTGWSELDTPLQLDRPQALVGLNGPEEGVLVASEDSWNLAFRIDRVDALGSTELASGIGSVEVMRWIDLGGGPKLHVAGSLGKIDLVGTPSIAVLDGGTWGPLGAGLDHAVLDMIEHDEGAARVLIAGGWFSNAGGAPASRIARWDGSAWSPLGSGCDDGVTALCSFGGEVYAGGEFQTAGGVAASHVARWDGSAWSPLGSGLAGGVSPSGGYPTVSDMVVFDDGRGPALYVAGDFDQAGGLSARNIARWDGTTWEAVGTGTDDPVLDLEVVDDGSGPALWLSGPFDVFDGVPSVGIARLSDPCLAASTASFCFGDDAACPCGNGGDGRGGCQVAQGTGGVRLELESFQPIGGSASAVLRGRNFPAGGTPAALLLRSQAFSPTAGVFGDGLQCVTDPLTRIGASIVAGSLSTHTLSHTDGPGVWYYQLQFRNQPASYCDASAGFNTSNALKLTW